MGSRLVVVTEVVFRDVLKGFVLRQVPSVTPDRHRPLPPDLTSPDQILYSFSLLGVTLGNQKFL